MSEDRKGSGKGLLLSLASIVAAYFVGHHNGAVSAEYKPIVIGQPSSDGIFDNLATYSQEVATDQAGEVAALESQADILEQSSSYDGGEDVERRDRSTVEQDGPNSNRVPVSDSESDGDLVDENGELLSQEASPVSIYVPAPTSAKPPTYGCAENGSCYGDPGSSGRPKTVAVNGYYRSDGTYVRGHYRSR